MFDLHCHLLPGIDDGAQNLKDALALARYAVKHGITHAVMTPHVHPGAYNNTVASIADAVSSFRRQLVEHGIALNIVAGGEVRVCAELLEMVPMNQVPFLGKSGGCRVILLEFPHSHILPGSEQMVHWLLEQHIRPLIAHPERNKELMDNPDKLRPLMELGCLLQLTAGSVAGYFGVKAQSAAARMLSNGWVSVLASDAHNLTSRVPDLMPGVEAAAKIVGMQAAKALVDDNPRRIAGGLFPQSV